MNAKLVLGRLFQSFVTIFGAITVVFLILRLTPGDPAQIILGDYATPELIERVREQYGLDKPIYEQYLLYIKNVATGDFGNSLFLKLPVVTLIKSAIPHTIILALAAMVITGLVGVPLGLIAALKRNTIADYASMLISMLGISTPEFWLALISIYFLSYKLGWFPVQGSGSQEGVLSVAHHLVLPAATLGIRSAALVARTTRAAILEVLNEDYVRTARAKGLAYRDVVRGHVVRNGLIPIMTVLGIYFGQLLGGATVAEIVFGRPGLGKLLVDSILARDYPLSQALIIVFLLAVTLVNLVVDLAYGFLDPRLRTG